jgi:hypothetical protein
VRKISSVYRISGELRKYGRKILELRRGRWGNYIGVELEDGKI